MANRNVEELNIQITADGATLQKDYKQRLRESRQFAEDLKAVFDKFSIFTDILRNIRGIQFGVRSTVASVKTLFREVRKIGPVIRSNINFQEYLSQTKGLERANKYLKEYRVLVRNIVFSGRVGVGQGTFVTNEARKSVLAFSKVLADNFPKSVAKYGKGLTDFLTDTTGTFAKVRQQFVNTSGVIENFTVSPIRSVYQDTRKSFGLIRKDQLDFISRLGIVSAASFQWFGETNRFFKRLSSQISTVVNSLSVAIPAAFALSARSLLKFQQAENLLAVSTGTNLREVRKVYSDVAQDIAEDTGIGVERVLLAIGRGISNGLKDAELITSVRLASIGESLGIGRAEDSIDAATTITTAYAESNLKAAEALDKLLKTSQLGSGSPDAFANALRPNVGLASKLKIEIDDLAGALSTLSRTVDVNQAGTLLRGFLAVLLSPTKQAVEALDAVGYSYERLLSDLEKPNGLVLVLQELAKFDRESITGTFTNVRALVAALTLNPGEVAANAREIRNATGEIQSFGYQTANTLPQIFGRITQSALKALREVGQEFLRILPVDKLQALAHEVIGIIKSLALGLAWIFQLYLESPLLRFFLRLYFLTVIFKPLIFLIATAAIAVVAFKIAVGFLAGTALPLLAKAIASVALKIWAFNLAIAFVPTLITAALVTIGLLFYYLVKYWDDILAYFRRVGEAFRAFWKSTIDFVQLLVGSTVIKFLADRINDLITDFKAFVGFISDATKSILEFLGVYKLVGRAVDLLKALGSEVYDFFANFTDNILNLFSVLFAIVANRITLMGYQIRLAWTELKAFILETLVSLGATTTLYLSPILGATGVTTATDFLVSLGNAASEASKDIDKLKESFADLEFVSPIAIKEALKALRETGFALGRTVLGIRGPQNNVPLDAATAAGIFPLRGGSAASSATTGGTPPESQQDILKRAFRQAGLEPLDAKTAAGIFPYVNERANQTADAVANSFSTALNESFRKKDFKGFFENFADNIFNAITNAFTKNLTSKFLKFLGFEITSQSNLGIPRFHSGGVYEAPPGRKEGLALLKEGEVVFNPNGGSAFNDAIGDRVVINQTNIVGNIDPYIEDYMARKGVSMAQRLKYEEAQAGLAG